MEERRSTDVRLAETEANLKYIGEAVKRIESKLDQYNGYREKLDSCQRELVEHKNNHWQATTILVAVVGIISTIATSLVMGHLKQ